MGNRPSLDIPDSPLYTVHTAWDLAEITGGELGRVYQASFRHDEVVARINDGADVEVALMQVARDVISSLRGETEGHIPRWILLEVPADIDLVPLYELRFVSLVRIDGTRVLLRSSV